MRVRGGRGPRRGWRRRLAVVLAIFWNGRAWIGRARNPRGLPQEGRACAAPCFGAMPWAGDGQGGGDAGASDRASGGEACPPLLDREAVGQKKMRHSQNERPGRQGRPSTPTLTQSSGRAGCRAAWMQNRKTPPRASAWRRTVGKQKRGEKKKEGERRAVLGSEGRAKTHTPVSNRAPASGTRPRGAYRKGRAHARAFTQTPLHSWPRAWSPPPGQARARAARRSLFCISCVLSFFSNLCLAPPPPPCPAAPP